MSADYTKALDTAQAAAGGQNYPTGTLYVVATPIGNTADITLRALHVLSLVDAIACEDTRHTAGLLRQYGLHKPLIALHQHNERSASDEIVARLQENQRIAYVSDAGTPCISDPGSVLCQVVRHAGLRIVPLPGASSATTLLSAAGLQTASHSTTQGFWFYGFLPNKKQERQHTLRNFFQSLVQQHGAVLFFDSPHRIGNLASDLLASLPSAEDSSNWELVIGRELTKQHEHIEAVTLDRLTAWFESDANHQRGEFALVLRRKANTTTSNSENLESLAPTAQTTPAHTALKGNVDTLVHDLLPHLPTKQVAQILARHSALSKNDAYELALEMKKTQA